MIPKAKMMETPVGMRVAPAHPRFVARLAQCKAREGLFAMVRCAGLVDPDALNEVMFRGLYGEYCQWKRVGGGKK